MTNSSVLVLNQNYQPLNICRARRAIVLTLRGKAEVLETDSREIRSPSCSFPLPSVIRLGYLIKRPRPQRKLTRREVFLRDHYTCQYCGKETRELTLDHVIPRHLGGEHSWDNVVSACKACNYRKAGRTPKEAGMRLTRQPSAPAPTSYYIVYPPQNHPEWQKYLPYGG
jgi:5-methylcytosine-specific restriction endonuclease McrA